MGAGAAADCVSGGAGLLTAVTALASVGFATGCLLCSALWWGGTHPFPAAAAGAAGGPLVDRGDSVFGDTTVAGAVTTTAAAGAGVVATAGTVAGAVSCGGVCGGGGGAGCAAGAGGDTVAVPGALGSLERCFWCGGTQFIALGAREAGGTEGGGAATIGGCGDGCTWAAGGCCGSDGGACWTGGGEGLAAGGVASRGWLTGPRLPVIPPTGCAPGDTMAACVLLALGKVPCNGVCQLRGAWPVLSLPFTVKCEPGDGSGVPGCGGVGRFGAGPG